MSPEKALDLYERLVVAVLGVVVPMVGLTLSVFMEGVSGLRTQYEGEREKAEKNLKDQLVEMGGKGKPDADAIEATVKELKTVRQAAVHRLSLLDPVRQTAILVACFALTLAPLLLYYVIVDPKKDTVQLWIALSVGSFLFGVNRLWRMLGVIVEARKFMGNEAKQLSTKVVELLQAQTDKGRDLFLEKVFLKIGGTEIKGKAAQLQHLSINSKTELEMIFVNSEKRMARRLQIGLIFPPEFLLEEKPLQNLLVGKEEQIMRWSVDAIHANTSFHLSPLTVTPLKAGTFKLRAFIKAENIESVSSEFSAVISSP